MQATVATRWRHVVRERWWRRLPESFSTIGGAAYLKVSNHADAERRQETEDEADVIDDVQSSSVDGVRLDVFVADVSGDADCGGGNTSNLSSHAARNDHVQYLLLVLLDSGLLYWNVY